ncbi:MAG: transcription termination factor NusA [Bryobacteraceae bacterium]
MGTIYQSIEILSKEKGIDPQIVIDAVKDAMLVAARKHFRSVEDLIAEFNAQGALEIFAVKTVADPVADPVKEISLHDAKKVDPAAELGSVVRISRPTDALGRISAQTAKQVILQKVREAERETIFSEYSGRVGELVNCVVKRIEGQDLIVDIGKTEARLPRKEQSRLENFSVGDRVRSIIKSVEKAGKNAGVTISRADPDLVKRLFEQEVPEIYDNTVVIKGCAREAGERTKIAVWSRDRDVDCVGACVGMKGMRVQSIIRELRGEKIDIIEYSDDPVLYATKALSPAKISRVAIVDGTARHMEVIVDDTQLSLAIGKKGQNVRLAAKLLGWKIDIKSEEEKRREVESAMAALVSPGAPVSVLMEFGLAENVVGQLIAGGVSTIEKLGGMTPEQLEELPGIGAAVVERIRDAVNGYYAQFDTPAEQAPGEFPAGDDTIAEAGAVEATEPGEAEPEASGGAEEPAAVAVDAQPPAEAAGPGTVPRPDVSEEENESDRIEDLGSRPLS